MARAASELLEQLLALCRHRSLSATAREPVLEIIRSHHRDPADHSRMLRAAIFRAEDVIASGLCRREPHVVVMPGHDVVLDPKCRYIEAVNDVFGSDAYSHRPAHRHMQLVDLALPFWILNLPHPLLADSVDQISVFRRRVRIVEDLRAP